jgi:hypothetical protein
MRMISAPDFLSWTRRAVPSRIDTSRPSAAPLAAGHFPASLFRPAHNPGIYHISVYAHILKDSDELAPVLRPAIDACLIAPKTSMITTAADQMPERET